MGVLYSAYSKESLIKSIINHETVIDSSVRSNRVWTLEKLKDGSTIAVVYLLKQSDNTYGYKMLSVDEFPYYSDCPERIIKGITHQGEGTTKWIKAVAATKAKQASTSKFFKSLDKGAIVTLDGKVFKFFGFQRGKPILAILKPTGELCSMYCYELSHFNDLKVGVEA